MWITNHWFQSTEANKHLLASRHLHFRIILSSTVLMANCCDSRRTHRLFSTSADEPMVPDEMEDLYMAIAAELKINHTEIAISLLAKVAKGGIFMGSLTQ